MECKNGPELCSRPFLSSHRLASVVMAVVMTVVMWSLRRCGANRAGNGQNGDERESHACKFLHDVSSVEPQL